jgi:hypothetical protein
MLVGIDPERIMRRIPAISFVAAALLAASANAQNLGGSFSTGPFGETFTIHDNLDGTAGVYDSEGRQIGQAEDNGYGHWDIRARGGGLMGEIQTGKDGSLEVKDFDGRHWGSGRVDSVK